MFQVKTKFASSRLSIFKADTPQFLSHVPCSLGEGDLQLEQILLWPASLGVKGNICTWADRWYKLKQCGSDLKERKYKFYWFDYFYLNGVMLWKPIHMLMELIHLAIKKHLLYKAILIFHLSEGNSILCSFRLPILKILFYLLMLLLYCKHLKLCLSPGMWTVIMNITGFTITVYILKINYFYCASTNADSVKSEFCTCLLWEINPG